MAPLTDAQLAESLVKVQDLLGRLKSLICLQSGSPDGSFGDLHKAEMIKPSKREIQALNARRKARNAQEKRQTAQKPQRDLKVVHDKVRAGKAGDEVIKTENCWAAIKDSEIADDEATKETERAIEKLGIIVNLRIASQAFRDQEAARGQAQEVHETAHRQALAASWAAHHKALAAQEATHRQAKEAQEAAHRRALEAPEATLRQAQEAKPAPVKAEEPQREAQQAADQPHRASPQQTWHDTVVKREAE